MHEAVGEVIGRPLDAGDGEGAAAGRAHREAAAQLGRQLAAHAGQREAAALARHRARGKWTARERVEGLLDPGAPFVELSALAGDRERLPGAGLVTGIGQVMGRPVVVIANDATVKGGTYAPATLKKHLRAQAIARQNRLITITLVDSGGIFLPEQADCFADRDHFGRIFMNQAELSAQGIPQLSAVMGMCTAGGAYVPAMSDENLIVAGTGTVYLAGPPLVRAATGEVVEPEALGGGAMHARVSGAVDHLVADDAAALGRLRDMVGALGAGWEVAAPPRPARPPRYPAEELYACLPPSPRRPLDALQLLARLVDDSRLHPFKADYGPELVCGTAHWMGFPVGVVANAGVLTGRAAQKGAHFVQLCDQRRLPLLFVHHITGFMVGEAAERGGIVRDGAKMVQAVATATVPRLSLVVGPSNGAGNYAMCGRGFDPRFLFAWPSARVGVMGPEQAAAVLAQVKRSQAEQAGRPWDPEEGERLAAPVRARVAAESDPYLATARLWDDGLIDPVDTRAAIGLCLAVAMRRPGGRRRPPVFRI